MLYFDFENINSNQVFLLNIEILQYLTIDFFKTINPKMSKL